MDELIKQGIKADFVLTDIPYGTTKCKWDSIIPFEAMWKKISNINKENGCVALFGIEPFSSQLRCSNIKEFRYDWIWEKDRHANFLFANKQPLKKHEIISIFYKKQPVYNPQMTHGKPNHKMFKDNVNEKYEKKEMMNQTVKMIETDHNDLKYPSTVQFFKCVGKGKNVHPTQKPVDLLEYLIRTYTNEGDTVLDFTMGSGSTGEACINTHRKFIGIEKETTYCNISKDRLLHIDVI